jgi:hypothetical protein
MSFIFSRDQFLKNTGFTAVFVEIKQVLAIADVKRFKADGTRYMPRQHALDLRDHRILKLPRRKALLAAKRIANSHATASLQITDSGLSREGCTMYYIDLVPKKLQWDYHHVKTY